MAEIFPLRPSYAEIDLDNLAYNFNEIRSYVGNRRIMGVLKADGYGHGAVEMARELLNQGIDHLGVAMLDEAIQLRKAGIAAPILILGYTPPEQAETCLKYGITPTVYTHEVVKAFSDAAVKMSKKAFVHIKIDTGMGRIGVSPEEAVSFASYLDKMPCVEIEGVFTHFSVADEEDKSYTYWQMDQFNQVLEDIEKQGNVDIPIKHIANSPGTVDLPEAHMDMVRVGLLLFGLYPSPHMKNTIDLRPVLTVKSQVSYAKRVPQGTSVGYGRKFITETESIIGTLPIGYADGYTRLLSNKGEVLVHGTRTPIVGAICMDQCMFLADEVPDVDTDDEVVLIGKQGNEEITVEEIADKLGTINYEIVTMLDKRMPRLYIKNGKVIKRKDLVVEIE